ncbi:hypothetical protein [Tenacibaculum sp.]|uniref:hypothetical protein n=1 Tax=Tenacibaculum sp. TaxID=1906242 RepID=UPI003D0E760F
MAYLDATDLNDLQSLSASNEKRFPELGLVDAVADSTAAVDYIDPSTKEQLRTMSSARNAQIPVLKDQDVTVVTTPGFNFIPSNLEESAQYTFTAVDVFSGLRHYPAQYGNNSIREEWAKKEKMKNICHKMGGKVEELLLTTLASRKTQALSYTTPVSATSGDYNFNTGTDTLEIKKAAQDETMYFSLVDLMDANEIGGNYRIVTSRAGLTRQRAEAAKYGAANDKNLQALGFFGNDMMYQTGSISAGSDRFNGYLFRDGAIGVIENHPYDFATSTSFGGKSWSISDMDLPFCRMRANVYVNNEATEAEALVSGGDSNLKMTHFAEMALWLRFYIVYRYNSDLTTRVNDIVKVQGLTT